MDNLSNIWKKLSASEFSKNVSSQMLGTGLAQILPFLATPLLTRLFTEDDFAVYTSFFAIASIFAVGAGGKYHLAIVLPKEENDSKKIFTISIYCTLVFSLLLAVLLPFFLNSFSSDLGNTLLFTPLYVLVFGIWSAYINVSIRHKKFKDNAVAKVLQSVTYILIAIGLGFSRFAVYGLVIAKISGTLFSSLFLSYKSNFSKPKWISLPALKPIAKKYIDYPKYGIWPSLLNTISLQALVLILTKYYAPSVGYFGLTYMVFSAPLGLIGASFKDVFYQKMTVLMNENKFHHANGFFKKSALALFAMGLPICFVLFFFGEPIFALIFGAKWSISGQFASIMAFSFVVKLMVSPLSSVFNATNNLRIASRWQVLYFLSTFATLGYCAAIWKLSVEHLLMVYVVHEIILYGIYFWLQLRTVKSYLDQ